MIPKEYKKYEKVVTIACINFNPAWGDKKANLKNIKDKIHDAADSGNNIIVFPELALSGYQCDGEKCSMHQKNAETIPGPSSQEIAVLAKKYNVYIIFGMPERDRRVSHNRYISSVLIGPEGIIGAYRKIHLATPPFLTESLCFKPGNDLPVFDTKFGPIGIQICYDFFMFPELSRILALKGARIIFNTCGSSMGPGKPYFLVQQTGARAMENVVFAATANLVGKDLSVVFSGHSTIAGPDYPKFMKVHAEGGEGEEIVSATINYEKLHKFRELVPWVKVRNGRLINKNFKAVETQTL